MKIERNIYDTVEVKAKLYIDPKGNQMSTALPPAELRLLNSHNRLTNPFFPPHTILCVQIFVIHTALN